MKHKESTIKTKRALSKALKEAMREKPFHKITVSALIQACGINRKTFYYKPTPAGKPMISIMG